METETKDKMKIEAKIGKKQWATLRKKESEEN